LSQPARPIIARHRIDKRFASHRRASDTDHQQHSSLKEALQQKTSRHQGTSHFESWENVVNGNDQSVVANVRPATSPHLLKVDLSLCGRKRELASKLARRASEGFKVIKCPALAGASGDTSRGTNGTVSERGGVSPPRFFPRGLTPKNRGADAAPLRCLITDRAKY